MRWLGCVIALAAVVPACAQPVVRCREPEVSIWTVEGEEFASCDLYLDRCDDDSYTTVSCSNRTFEGNYECTWMQFTTAVTPTGGMATGEWESDDFCRLDVDGMVAELDAAMPVEIRIE